MHIRAKLSNLVSAPCQASHACQEINDVHAREASWGVWTLHMKWEWGGHPLDGAHAAVRHGQVVRAVQVPVHGVRPRPLLIHLHQRTGCYIITNVEDSK